MVNCSNQGSIWVFQTPTTNFKLPARIVDSRPFLVPRADAEPLNSSTNQTVASLMICLVPKAASTSIKRWLWQTLEMRGIPICSTWRTTIHNIPVLSLPMRPTNAFMVVRHPALRLASAWFEIERKNFWFRLPGLSATRRVNFSFEHTLRRMITTHPGELNEHLRPMIYMCGLVGGRGYNVLKLEELDTWGGKLALLVGAPDPLTEKLLVHASTSAVARLYSTPEIVRLVDIFTAADRNFFKYEPYEVGYELCEMYGGCP